MLPLMDDDTPFPLKSTDCMLVIVDMQHRYETSRGRKLQEAVRAEILTAKSLGWWIIVLEFGDTDPHSPTYPFLMEPLIGYQRCLSPIIKVQPDGSREIKQACLNRLIMPKKIRVCGVNIGACVRATVDGLVAEFSDAVIQVVRKACNDVDPHEKWRYILHHPRVFID